MPGHYSDTMGELLYEDMSPSQAAEALEEFLAERDPALEQLRSAMTPDGLDPQVMLDGTLDSVAQVWEWITGRAAELGVAPWSLRQDPTRPSWPS